MKNQRRQPSRTQKTGPSTLSRAVSLKAKIASAIGARDSTRASTLLLELLDRFPCASHTIFAANQLRKLDLKLPQAKVYFLADSAIAPVRPYLETELFRAGLSPEVTVGNYGQLHSEIAGPDGPLYESSPDIV